MRNSTEKLNALTSLRFFAAFMIILGHSSGIFFKLDFFGHFSVYQGVSFFFVLSGFILAYVYPQIEKGGVPKFFLARFARIWPAHIAALLLFFLLLFPSTETSLTTALQKLILFCNITMIHAWIPNAAFYFSFNSPSWSVSTEVFFYLLFPLLIFRLERTWFVKLIMTFIILLSMIIICNVTHIPELSAVPSIHALIYINPLSHVFEFMLGITMVLGYKKLKKLNISFFQASFIETILLLLTLISLYFDYALANSLQRYVGLAGKYWILYSGSCFCFGALFMVIALQKGVISKWLNLRFFVLLGELSYALYLLHYIFRQYYINHYGLYNTQYGGFLSTYHLFSYVAYWVLLLTSAYLMWRFIECPARTFIVKLPNRISKIILSKKSHKKETLVSE